MGLFDDLMPRTDAAPTPGGLFGDLVPARGQAAKNAVAEGVRQVGLTARYALEGLPQIADFALTPVRAGVNAGARAVGLPEVGTLAEFGQGLANTIGLPEPRGALERVVGDATRTGFGAAGGAGVGKMVASASEALPTVRAVAQQFAANPGAQAISGAAAGGAGGAVRENGGSAGGQALAAVAAGVGAPLAAGGLANAGRSAAAAMRQRLDPQRLEAVLTAELGKAGINWAELGAATKVQLQKDAAAAVYSGQPIDAKALRRLADYRSIGATPLLGDITQDPQLLTLQRNLTKQLANMSSPTVKSSLPDLSNQNARRVIDTLDGAARSEKDAYSTGQGLIDAVKGKDAALSSAEDALYKQARAAAGRDIPLARGAFVDEAFGNLARNNKMAFLPAEVGELLNQISAGQITRNGKTFEVPFTVDTIDMMKTTLASASRGAKDGNVKAAISAVRDALENAQPAPIKRDFGAGQVVTEGGAATLRAADDSAAQALDWFNQARTAARGRRNWQESAPFIEDALGGAAADTFVQRHVIGSSVENLAKLKGEIAKQPDLLNATRKQMVDYIRKRGRTDGDAVNFNSAGLRDGLKAIGDRRLALFFQPEEIAQIRSAVNVARYSQSQPIGSAVNNSNSAAMLMGRLGDLMTAGSAVPLLGPMVADPLRGATLRLQSVPLGRLSQGLVQRDPAAGSKAAVLPLASLLAAPSLNQPKDDRGP